MKLGIVIALTVTLGAVQSAFDVQRRKPMIEQITPSDRWKPPTTLQELINNVDLVAHVQILSSEPRRRQVPGGHRPETIFVAEIVEKGRSKRPGNAGERLRILQGGGDFEEADRIERFSEEGNPPLAAGRSYILALNWNQFMDVYVLAYGPDSVFEIHGGKVYPRGKGRGARELGVKDLKEAIRRIK